MKGLRSCYKSHPGINTVHASSLISWFPKVLGFERPRVCTRVLAALCCSYLWRPNPAHFAEAPDSQELTLAVHRRGSKEDRTNNMVIKRKEIQNSSSPPPKDVDSYSSKKNHKGFLPVPCDSKKAAQK